MVETKIFNTGETARDLKEMYNPEGSLKRRVQLRLLDMLLYLDEACKKNGIDYRIDGGTVLGALRHGGFIPWDDDVDVVVAGRYFGSAYADEPGITDAAVEGRNGDGRGIADVADCLVGTEVEDYLYG